MNYEAELSRWTTQVVVGLDVGCCALLFLVVVCWASLLFVLTGNVTCTRASIIRRMGYITGTCTMAEGSSPDG